MLGRLWKGRGVHEFTAALVAFVLYDLLRHDDTKAVSDGWPANDSVGPATDALNDALADWNVLGSHAFDGDSQHAAALFNDNAVIIDGVQCPDWHLVGLQYEYV